MGERVAENKVTQENKVTHFCRTATGRNIPRNAKKVPARVVAKDS